MQFNNNLNLFDIFLLWTDEIYVVGGTSDLGVELDIVECYTPSLRDWKRLSHLAVNRAYVGVVALEGCIYAVGGWNEQDGALKSVEKYCVEEVMVMKMV